MSTINKVILIGHLGDEMKLHHFDGGGCVGRAPLATNESWVDKNTNEKKQVTDWHNILLRNKQAETFEKYTSKGDKVYVEGKLKTRKWQDDKGNDRYTTEVHVFSFTFLTTKNSNNNQNTADAPAPIGDDNDDLPF